MMSEAVLQLSVLSVFCGAVIMLSPEGGPKNVSQILCSSVLLLSLLQPILEMDFEAYALESAKLHEIESAFSSDASSVTERLNYLVIQNEYQEYIFDKALELGVEAPEVTIELLWNTEGLWVPYSAELHGSFNETQKKTLKNVIQDDLGIPFERQRWNDG